jgi:hypothetical protein
MKIISIRQPWATLIVIGATDIATSETTLKDVENRSWATAYRGPVLVHASARPDRIASHELAARFGVRPPSEQPLGGVIGLVDIVDCVRASASRWHAPGHWGFALADARPLPFTPWKGALGLRTAPAELLEIMRGRGKSVVATAFYLGGS